MTKPSLIADLIERLDEERRYEFEERAGIIEFDAEQTRDQAELLALVDLLREHPAALVGGVAADPPGTAEQAAAARETVTPRTVPTRSRREEVRIEKVLRERK